ncbi:MAG: DNA repair protein RecO [Bacteroidales bacterium]
MYERVTGIVLHITKYSDKNSIVHIYTDKYGKLSFLISESGGKVAKMRRAILMPLSLVEVQARMSAGKEIYTMSDVRLLYNCTSIHSDPIKNAIAMFMAELISRSATVREENSPLFRYLFQSIELLNHLQQGVANYHICFIYNLGAFLGIQPYIESYTEGAWFDMINGRFSRNKPTHNNILEPEMAQVIIPLSRMTFSNLHKFNFNRSERNQILDIIIRYYQVHNSTIGTLRSPEILKQLFN